MNVYWADTSDGSIHSMPIGGGAPTLLAQGQAKPVRIAMDSSYVYWSNNLGGAIMRTLKAGTGTPEVVAAAGSPYGIATDATSVYWVNATDGTIRSAPTDGGSTQSTLATINAEQDLDLQRHLPVRSGRQYKRPAAAW